MVSFTPFLDAINKIKSIKATETLLPISKKRCIVSSLLVGDDLALRTSTMSLVAYDRELIKILHNHTEFIEDEKNVRPSYDKFVKELSAFDKLSLLWGLYKSSYDVLDNNRTIRCQNKMCKAEFQNKILMDELIHEDTYTFWEEELPFYEYRFPIEINYNGAVLEFYTKTPSVKDTNSLLGHLSNSDVQRNLDTTGEMYTKSQYMALATAGVRTYDPNTQMTQQTESLQEILMSFEKLPYVIYEEFFDKYNTRFSKYDPKFYKKVECPECGFGFDYKINLEVEFLYRSLHGPGTSQQTL